MLWLCIHLPRLPLEALRSNDDGRASVVTSCDGQVRLVTCCNEAAERARLSPGMNYSTALVIHPDLDMLERKPYAEEAALRRLAAWAYQFSSTVILGEVSADPHRARSTVLWLEIGASLKLFGGFRRLMERFEEELGRLGYTYQLGVGPTLEGAALLARAGIRVALTTTHALCMRIRHLPLLHLPLEPDVVHQLHISGVRTIGLLLELPRDGVAKRFGPQVSRFLDRLVGEAPDPRPAFELPTEYAACFEFEAEVRSTQAMLFTLRRLLHELAGFLRARDTGVQRFTLQALHRESPPTTLHIGLTRPDRNAERFFSVVRERLERVELPAPCIGVHLSAREFADPTALQPGLFGGAAGENEDLSHTIDRIAARVGNEHVHGLKATPDHRPEAAWSKAAPDEKRPTLDFPDRPLWLLPEPRPLQLSTMPQITSGPERIETGWWDGGDVQRDYFIVRTSNGADLWVYRDLKDRNWYLHGFWS